MDSNDRKRLERLLAEMDGGSRLRLAKRATALRKLHQTSSSHGNRRGREEDAPTYERKRDRTARSGSLRETMLALLAEELVAEDAAASDDARVAIVASIVADSCEVLLDDELLHCGLAPGLARTQQTSLAVGDRVALAQGEPPVVRAVLPRTSSLSRPDPGPVPIERVLAANIELVVAVASFRDPPLKAKWLDRIVLAATRGKVRPILCANKHDLVPPEEREAAMRVLDSYRAAGFTAIACSASTGEGVEELRDEMGSAFCAFVGHSGVGKSSLLNALAPDLQLVTGDVRRDGKGRHTTTRSTLYRLAGGAWVIDTPGIRTLGLEGLAEEDWRDAYPDIAALAEGCRFRDCAHGSEPGCAVQGAVRSGRLDPERVASYRKLR